MAAYTSTQTGNFDAVATWGGGGAPTVAADTFTVAAGHTVTVNVVQTVELGASAITGILKFLETANTKLTFGNVTLTVNSGGELRMGNATTVIGSAYLAELIFNTTSDNANGVTVANGGILNAYGDPAVYGSDPVTTLAANWDSAATATFTVVGNYTTKWKVGQEITAHKYTYGAWGTDTALFTIAALTLNGANTDIQVNGGTAPALGTFYTKGRVANVTRNVKLYKLSAATAIGNYNTNRPRILDSNVAANNNCYMSNVQITGFYRIDSPFNFHLLNSVVRNGNNAIYTYNATSVGVSGIEVSGFIYSMNYGFYIVQNATISVDVYCCATGFEFFCESIVSGDVYGNNYAFYASCAYTKISGNVYSNNNAANTSDFLIIEKSARLFKNNILFNNTIKPICYGSIGWDKDGVSAPNTTDFSFGSSRTAILRGAKLPSAGLVFSNRNSSGFYYIRGYLQSENHGQVNGAQYRYEAYGDVIKNTATLRTGGADNSIEVIPLSNCNSKRYISVIDWGKEWVEFAVPASAQIRTVYIKGEAWTVWPTASELWFEAEYISNATTLETTTIKSTAVLADNTTWVAFTVNFTPVAVGIVRYRIYLGKYQASAKAYVDNKLYTA